MVGRKCSSSVGFELLMGWNAVRLSRHRKTNRLTGLFAATQNVGVAPRRSEFSACLGVKCLTHQSYANAVQLLELESNPSKSALAPIFVFTMSD